MSNYGKDPSRGIALSNTGVKIENTTKTDVVAAGIIAIASVGIACIGGIVKLVSMSSK